MATLQQLETALVKADRAGDTKSATIFAKEIKNLRELRSIDDYNIFAEASKSVAAGGAQTVLMTMDTLGTIAADLFLAAGRRCLALLRMNFSRKRSIRE